MVKQLINILVKNKDFNNVISSLFSYIIIPIFTVITTPILLKTLGTEIFGLWMLIQSILMILTISDMGITSAIVKFGSSYLSKSEKTKFVTLIEFCFAMTIILSIILNLFTYLFANVLAELMYHADSNDTGLAIESFRILGIIVGIRLIGNVFSGVVMAHERYDIKSKVNVFSNLMMNILSVVLVINGFNIIALVKMLIIISLLSSILFLYSAKKIFKELTCIPRLSSTIGKEVICFSFLSWLQVSVNMIYSQSDRIIISSFLGPTALSYYSVCIQLTSKIHELPAAICAYLLPRFSALNENRDFESLRKIYIISFSMIMIFVISVGFTLLIHTNTILSAWISQEFANRSELLFKLLTISFLGVAVGIIPYYFLNAVGSVSFITKMTFVNSTLSVILSLFLTPYFGTIGTALGRLVNIPINIIIKIFIEKKLLHVSKKFIILHMTPLLVIILLSYLWTFNGEVVINSLTKLMLAIFSTAIIIFLCSYYYFRIIKNDKKIKGHVIDEVSVYGKV